jgi:hypothetical protein
MVRRYADYLRESEDRPNLADQIANSTFEDPVPRIWISPLADDPSSDWSASWQFGEENDEFSGTLDEVVAWARRQPAVARMVLLNGSYAEVDPLPDDEPAPPAAGPSVRIMGPDYDGRWVALWYHRGVQKQFWSSREEVTGWALAQPAERRFIEGSKGWLSLEE